MDDVRDDVVVKVEGLSKEYRLGAIGGGTLTADLQSWWAGVRGREDPNRKIGARVLNRNERFLALTGVDLEVHKGDALGIIGSNGAGKSTLLKILSRVTAPTTGTVSILGRLSCMLEVGTGFSPEMTGRENIFMNGAILGMSRNEVKSKLDEIIAFSECERFIDTPVKRYSSGMYVKLAFAVAAHLDSDILVMDEVLAVGDMKFQDKCLGKMGDLSGKGRRTILYVSHNMSSIRQLCNRCIVLDHGAVKYDGTVDKAIEIHAADASEMAVFNDFSLLERPAGRKPTVQIQSVEFQGRKDCRVRPGELLRIRLLCKVFEPVEDVRVRAEFSYWDHTRVGTAFTNRTFHAEPGADPEVDLTLDIASLAAGRYRVRLVLYRSNEFGTQTLLDSVNPAFSFEVLQEFDENHLNWPHAVWGHVRLPDIGMHIG